MGSTEGSRETVNLFTRKYLKKNQSGENEADYSSESTSDFLEFDSSTSKDSSDSDFEIGDMENEINPNKEVTKKENWKQVNSKLGT